MGVDGLRRRRRHSRRAQAKRGKKFRLTLLIVALWLLAVALVFALTDVLADHRESGQAISRALDGE